MARLLSSHRSIRSLGVLLAIVVAVQLGVPASTGRARAAASAPAGDVVAIGDSDALAHVDLFLDPLCPFSGEMVRTHGDEIGRRVEEGRLRIDLRWVDFLDGYSASGSYDRRAIYATYVVSDQTKSSEATWRFVEEIYAPDRQPREKGPTDLSDGDLADLAGRAGAPQLAQDLIRLGIPIGSDPRAIAARNLDVLHRFPNPGVPLAVVDGQPFDGDSDWLAKLQR